MKLRTLPPLLLVALLLAGCGSSGGPSTKLASSDIAAVGSQHVTLVQFNQALTEQQASMKAAGTALPKAGTSAFQSLQTTIIDALVQQAEFAIEAAKFGVSVSGAETLKQLDALKKKYFHNSDTTYRKALKQQGFTDAEVRTNISERLLQQKLFAAVTKSTKVTDAQVNIYYLQNIGQYQKAASRKVREILAGKNKQKLAAQIYSQLKAGASFAALAKRYSQDPGSKNSGGVFTATQGADVPEFDKAVFAAGAKTGQLLAPVKTAQYGWFVIQPLAAIVPAKTTPESAVAAAIRTQLTTTQKQQALSLWVQGIAKSFCNGGTISYQAGYAPSPDPCASISATNPTTT
jgi:parvulin-like peptidyl-prolyl isomerase